MLLHPITVQQCGNGYYLICGNHRLHAYEQLDRTEIPAFVIPEDTDEDLCRILEIDENLTSAIDMHHTLRDELIMKRKEHYNNWQKSQEGVEAQAIAKMLEVIAEFRNNRKNQVSWVEDPTCVKVVKSTYNLLNPLQFNDQNCEKDAMNWAINLVNENGKKEELFSVNNPKVKTMTELGVGMYSALSPCLDEVVFHLFKRVSKPCLLHVAIRVIMVS
jgi:hypothetical protein